MRGAGEAEAVARGPARGAGAQERAAVASLAVAASHAVARAGRRLLRVPAVRAAWGGRGGSASTPGLRLVADARRPEQGGPGPG